MRAPLLAREGGSCSYQLMLLADALGDTNKGSPVLQSGYETECQLIIYFWLVVSKYELSAFALASMTGVQD